MNPQLENKYLRLEASRNRLLDELEALDEQQLNTAPAEGKWSINQHVAHLVLVDEQTLSYIQHKLQQQDTLEPSTFSCAVKAFILKLALISGRKYKAPAPVATVPDYAQLQHLRQQWDAVRFNLEDVLTELPPNLVDKCLFKHPYVGPLNMLQTLSFLQDHFDHHQRAMQAQAEALVR
ncbi:DinB family protein [Pontibacter actiniarum]|uniref:DinB-like domain-containing protein n=1 Tax=Pontibacter actiniarum TaxID=323450 RepID=A0A1X9YR90_9BACT|nr:DinB family protein [Pontibacter actiniarum]ARS35361.1 hypothetical protein CA264_07865 [Pontibacter actiniarum]